MKGNLKQRFEGMLSALVSKLTPEVTSESSFIYDRRHHNIINTATTHIKFDVPSWLPISPSMTERLGTRSLQKTMSRDLKGILDKILKQYTTTSLNRTKQFQWFNADHNREFDAIMNDAKERLLKSFDSGLANL